MDKVVLEKTAQDLVAPNKGILAADESTGSIKKRFDAIGIESTPESNRLYRQLLFTTPKIEEFISGVIMFDETIRQNADDGVSLPSTLVNKGIIPGIKVDKGTVDLANFPAEKITEGLDGLRERFAEYRTLGARFAKWRGVITIGEGLPSRTCLEANADLLARYAALAQEADIVPIIEPEVLTDGIHNLKKSEEVTYQTLKIVFNRLSEHKIHFPGMLLKPNWVHAGKDSGVVSDDKEVAEATLRVLKETVPADVPGVVFLSGGDAPGESTSHLDVMNEIDHVPWQLSFSFGRALQEPVLKTWAGSSENVKAAQEEFYKRSKLNSLARTGAYKKEMESK